VTQLTQSPCFKSAGVASSAALPGRTARYKYDAPFRACSTGMIASPSEVMTSRWLVCVCNIATCPTWSIVRSSSRNGTAEAAKSCVIASSVTKHDLPIAPMRDILLRNRTGEYSCREQACRNLTDLDTMLRAAFACHIVQKPACGTCATERSHQQRNGSEADFGTTAGSRIYGWGVLRQSDVSRLHKRPAKLPRTSFGQLREAGDSLIILCGTDKV